MIPPSKRVTKQSTQLPIHIATKKRPPQQSQTNSPKHFAVEIPTPKYTQVPQTVHHQKMDEIDLLREVEAPSNQPPKRESTYSLPVQFTGPTSRRSGCREHEDEEVTYYCFTCLANICPECAIHGTSQLIKALTRVILCVRSKKL